MKKLILATLTIVLLSTILIACNPTNKGQAEKVNIVNPYTTDGKVTKLIADETATGELTVSVLGNEKNYGDALVDSFSLAVLEFKKLYPNVKINVQRVESGTNWSESYSDYFTKLSTEVMAGNGPDVFFVSGSFMDVPKMCRSGVFADMHEYFEKDQNFNIKDYNEKVFCGGQPEGKQYIIPLNYGIPLFISTEKVLEKNGFNPSKCTDFLSCYEEIARVTEKKEKNPKFEGVVTQDASVVAVLYPSFTGFNWVDYDSKTVNIYTPEMRRMLELYKELYYEPDEIMTSGGDYALKVEKLLNEQVLADISFDFDYFLNEYQLLSELEEPFVFPWRNANEKIQAIVYQALAVSNNCDNKENAYRFIKTLISPEIQLFENRETGTVLREGMHIPSICNTAVKARLEERTTNPEMTINNVYKFGKDWPLISRDFIDQYMGFLSEVEVSDYGLSKCQSIFQTEMKPYLDDKKSYEECIKNAEDKLKIYISE